MKKVIGSLIAVAGLAAAAHGQSGTTILETQVSLDGINWFSSVDANPGQQVEVRYRVSLTGATALGFQGINYQPVFSGWDGAGGGNNQDQMRPFAATGSNTTGAVNDAPGPLALYGRIRPFAAPNVTAANALTVHSDGASQVRIAQLPVTNPVGSGSSVNNVNGSGGIPQSQSPGTFNPPPAFEMGVVGKVIARFAIRVSDDLGDRSIICSVPMGSISQYGPTSALVRAGNWLQGHDQDTGSPISNYAQVDLSGATATIRIPTPGALALLGLGGLAVGRRRR